MTEPTATPPERQPSSWSVLPYALFVPVLVVFTASALDVQEGSSLSNTLLFELLREPVLLVGVPVISLISFFLIRPLAGNKVGRWVAFLGCVLGFTMLVRMLLPRLME